VTYDKAHPHSLVSWGFNAIRRSYHEEHEEGPFTWFKLLLQRPENPESKENSELKTLEHLMKKFGKNVQDITVDFLRCLWDYTKKQLQFILGEDFMHRFSVRVILTIPAVWKPATIIMMKDLAKKAGLPENTDLLPEPEAAAIAVLGRAARRALLEAEDVITVCDAGGGTCVSHFRLAILVLC
jgi:molecular chaperone DnaK (HSP70)